MDIDVTAPGARVKLGSLHPITKSIQEINAIFSSMGFEIVSGSEIVSEEENFDVLNIPKNHPARDMWDTIWLKDGNLLRTHTSSAQVPYMKTHPMPISAIVPGKVYRYEATDATHETEFYQLEGFMVSENITLGNLKGVLQSFFSKFYGGTDMEVRFRPGYFPFVEPGVEVDMRRNGEDKWLEMGGAGMIHPTVLKNADIDVSQYQGFAFGVGIDRLTMLKYKIDDVRLFHSGDLRFIGQF